MSKYVDWGLIHGEGDIICNCDNCDCEEDYAFENGPDFKNCQQYLRDLGWISRNVNEEWYDFCSEECFNEWKEKRGLVTKTAKNILEEHKDAFGRLAK